MVRLLCGKLSEIDAQFLAICVEDEMAWLNAESRPVRR